MKEVLKGICWKEVTDNFSDLERRDCFDCFSKQQQQQQQQQQAYRTTLTFL